MSLKYRIERFFRVKNNLEKFKKVAYMINNNKSLSMYRDAPNDFLHYLYNNNIVSYNVGYYKFTDLGLKYYNYYRTL